MSTLTNRYVIDTHFSVCVQWPRNHSIYYVQISYFLALLTPSHRITSQRDKNYANVSPKKDPYPIHRGNFHHPEGWGEKVCLECCKLAYSALTTNFHILVSRGGGWLGISLTIKF